VIRQAERTKGERQGDKPGGSSGKRRIDRATRCPYIALMAIRDILIIPDKRLRLKSEPVKAVDKALRALVDDMFATMYAAPGIGLAAIQVGVAQRVVIMDLAKKDDPPEPQVFINPEVIGVSAEKSTYEEGCLSIPEYYEEVERPSAVKVKYLDLDGKPQEIEASGLLATCLQHEIDHTNGVLFIDYISKLKRDMVMKRFKKAAKKGEPVKPLSEDKEPSHHIG
jgi:peptide deformylase